MGAGKEKVPINDESLNQRWDFLMMHYFKPTNRTFTPNLELGSGTQ